MDIVWVLLGIASIIYVAVGHWNAWEHAQSLEPSHTITVEVEDKPLPEFIKKDRTIEYRYQWEWKKEWTALVQNSCTEHFGKDQCNNCSTWDHSTPCNCSCDKFIQKNGAGEIVLSSRSPDPFCDYHTKDHSFV
jgi:hypothetical protein